MKKTALILIFILVFTSSVYGRSRNEIVEKGSVKKAGEAVSAELVIKPVDEVETGAYVEIEFENAVVFSQEVIDGNGNADEIGFNGSGRGYQYEGYMGYRWNGKSGFGDVMSGKVISEVPYKITKLSDYKIRVSLCNVPAEYAGKSLSKYNNSADAPYYSIPLPVYVKEDGYIRIKMSGKVNDTSLTYSNYVFNKSENDSVVTTEEITETTTAEVTKNENISKVNKVSVTIGSCNMSVNGNNIEIDVPPYIQSGSWATLVPLRAVSIAITDGYSGKGSINIVSWDADTKTAIIKSGSKEISFTAGSGYVNVDGEETLMENGVKAEISEGRMFVPFRVLGEVLGAEVDWDSSTKTAYYN